MGRPKQLLPINGTPLVVRAVEAALGSQGWPVVVVLGHASAQIRPLLARQPVLSVENFAWAEGMGTSIRSGIQTLDRFSENLGGAVIALADQPDLTGDAIDRLFRSAENPGEIAAARYAGAVGSPVYFPREYFEELRALPASHGAQGLLKTYADRVRAVDFPELAIDLDTPEDYQNFVGRKPLPE
jgi:molybdenum cofactor cytidylyltransferase